MNHTIKTRFAPSPTGFLHIGGLRTALYNYLFARHNKGKVILRVEDTDKKRYVKGAVEDLLKTLNAIGLKFDEGVVIKGNKIGEVGEQKPYIQSKRLKIYQKHLKTLLDNGNAYYCFCSQERLKRIKGEQASRKEPTKYDGHCRKLPEAQIKNFLKEKRPYTIRLKVPENKNIKFTDLVYGKIKVNTSDIDDQILLKSDGFPTYHLANVIDDYLMGITHIIRGEEWLSSTLKHILLYQAFNWPLPLFVHLPLIINKDRSKLSKRDGDITVEDFLKQGYLPEALINYIVFLGWNPKDEKEIFSLRELIQVFDLKKINKASAIFDLKKLQWLNSYYIKKLPINKLIEKTKSFIKYKVSNDFLEKILTVEQSRLITLSEIGEGIDYFFDDPVYRNELIIFRKSNKENTKIGLEKAKEVLNNIKEGDWTKENLLSKLHNIVKQNNLSPGDIFWPIRYALSGKEKSPSPEELLWVFGKKESIKRISNVINILK